MSLIDDALKRAREEAARQDASRRVGASRWAPSHIPGAKRSPAKMLAALAAVFLLGVGAAWLLLGPSRVPPVPAPAGLPSLPVPAPVVAPIVDRSAPEKDSAPRAKVPGRRAPSGIAPRPAPSSGTSSAETPASASARPPQSPAAPSRRSFVHTAALPNGETIELGGIVYSETNPVALLNGKVVAPGGSVGDFTVVQIRPDRVDLSGDGQAFSILLR